jgi:hypothetical protein
MKWVALAAAAAAMCSAAFLSTAGAAEATVIYSITGVVGDSNWYGGQGYYSISTYINFPVTDYPPGFDGSFGTFSTKPVEYFYTLKTSAVVTSAYASDDFFDDGGEFVLGPMGGSFSAYGGAGIDGGGSLAQGAISQNSFTQEITSVATSSYDDEGYIVDDYPRDDDYAYPVTGEVIGYGTQTQVLDAQYFVSVAGYAGQPYSLQIYSAVPEPASWALIISGMFGAGLMLRRRDRATSAI